MPRGSAIYIAGLQGWDKIEEMMMTGSLIYSSFAAFLELFYVLGVLYAWLRNISLAWVELGLCYIPGLLPCSLKQRG